jgi:hypothetical protein
MKSILSAMLLITLSVGCGHFGRGRDKGDDRQEQTSRVDRFIEEHASKHTEDQEFLNAYRSYLNSVQDFYVQNDIENKFDSYLDSLRENHEELAQLRSEMTGGEQQAEQERFARPWIGDRDVPQEERGPLGIGEEDRLQAEEEGSERLGDWRKEEGRIGQRGQQEQDRQGMEERLQRTEKLTSKYDQLTREREQQLREELGEDMFSKLKTNYRDFQASYEGTKYYFPI